MRRYASEKLAVVLTETPPAEGRIVTEKLSAAIERVALESDGAKHIRNAASPDDCFNRHRIAFEG